MLDRKAGAEPDRRAAFEGISSVSFTKESMINAAPGIPVEWSIAVFLFEQMWKHAVLDVLSGIDGLIFAWSSVPIGEHHTRAKLNSTTLFQKE